MKILIVDDHPLFREGVGMLLSQYDASMQTAFASTIAEAITAAQENAEIDLILLDLGLPDGKGLEGLERLRESCYSIPVVILSAADEPRLILDCLDRGAMGFLTKSSPTELFRAALKLVVLGSVYIPPEALSTIAGTQGVPQRDRPAKPSLVFPARPRSSRTPAPALRARGNA